MTEPDEVTVALPLEAIGVMLSLAVYIIMEILGYRRLSLIPIGLGLLLIFIMWIKEREILVTEYYK